MYVPAYTYIHMYISKFLLLTWTMEWISYHITFTKTQIHTLSDRNVIKSFYLFKCSSKGVRLLVLPTLPIFYYSKIKNIVNKGNK